MLDFMFVNCPPCRTEMAHLVRLRENYSSDELTIMSLDLDLTESEAMLAAFRDEFGATWHFAMDTDGIREKYQVRLFPSIMVVGVDGEPAFSNEGVVGYETLSGVVDSLL